MLQFPEPEQVEPDAVTLLPPLEREHYVLAGAVVVCAILLTVLLLFLLAGLFALRLMGV